MINFIIAVRIVLFFKKYETVANGFVKDGENIQKMDLTRMANVGCFIVFWQCITDCKAQF